MKKIGIIPYGNFFLDENPFNNVCYAINNYFKRINECGAKPILLFPIDGIYNDNDFEDIDAFLICGGADVKYYHLQAIDFAVKNNKPLLGICLGMQALGVYSVIKDEFINHKNDVNYINNILKKENIPNMKYIEETNVSIHDHSLNTNTLEETKHSIIINNNSLLYDVFKESKMFFPSLHKEKITYIGPDFKVTAISSDNIIEAIEYKSGFIMGVQFHPELEDKNLVLFKRLIKETLL